MRGPDPFSHGCELDNFVAGAIHWICTTSPGDIKRTREEATQGLERMAEALWDNGSVEAWSAGVDEQIRRITETVNGPALERIAGITNFCDPGCVELFRQGADLVGRLPLSGLGSEREHPPWSLSGGFAPLVAKGTLSWWLHSKRTNTEQPSSRLRWTTAGWAE